MKLGFIGFGEVGFEVSRGLKEEGLVGIVAYDVLQNDSVKGNLIKEHASIAAVTLLESPKAVLDCVDIVIVAVPGTFALETAKQLKPHVRKGLLYVDVSAASPETKRRIADELTETEILFVDGAMLGSLPLYKHKVPMLISGNGSDLFINLMKDYHLKLDKISDVPGEATGIKFVRSIFMKGLPALFVEVLEAAALMKVDNLVLESLASTMDACPFEETFNRLVTGSALHAERRAHEMESVIEMLESLNVEPTMSKATAERLTWLASKKLNEKFEGKTPKTWQEVITAWN